MGQRGFTLIEVLASVAILGLGIVAVMRLFSGSLGLAKASSDSTAKVVFAKDKMNEVLISKSIREGVSRGASEDLNWVLDIREFDDKLPQGAPKVFRVELNVSGPNGAPVKLTTLKTIFNDEKR